MKTFPKYEDGLDSWSLPSEYRKKVAELEYL